MSSSAPQQTIISIDVGIRNLAFCLFRTPSPTSMYTICDWRVVDITTTDASTVAHSCSHPACINTAAWQTPEPRTYVCKVHATRTKWAKWPRKYTPKYLSKLLKPLLTSVCEEVAPADGASDIPSTKKAMIEWIHLVKSQHYLTPVVDTSAISATTMPLADVGRNLIHHFRTIIDNYPDLAIVVIENQIGPLAVRMKTLQGMIAMLFVAHFPQIKIETVSSSRKLQQADEAEPETDAKTYADRKKQGVKRCRDYLTTSPELSSWVNYFNSNKKKDDLADCFLQGLWYMSSTQHQVL